MTSDPSAKFNANIIAPEDCKPNTVYAITINPNDKMQHFDLSVVQRWNTFTTKISKDFMDELAPFSKYTLYIELSKKGRLHMHGTIEITDVFGFYMRAIPYLCSHTQIEMDTIKDITIWNSYCTKQKLLFKDRNNVITSKIPTITTTPLSEWIVYEKKK